MPGPTQPWDQSEDPHESTVDLPRPVIAHPAPAIGSAPPPARRASAPAESTGLARAGSTPRGSLAELRSRLARLPDGHPSSPYDDAGQVRPLPIRLKLLELGLPAPEREPASNVLPSTATAGAEPVIGEFPEPDAPERDVALPQVPAEPHSSVADSSVADSSVADGAEPHSAEPDDSRADSAEPAGAEPEGAEPEGAEPEGAEPEGAEPHREAVDDATPAGATSADDALTGRNVEEVGLTPIDAASDSPPSRAPGISPNRAADDGRTPFPALSGDGRRPRRPEWGDPYASYGNGNGPSDLPAEVNLGPWQPGPPRRGSGLEGLSSAGGNGHGRTNGHVSSQRERGSQPRSDRLDPSLRDAARQDTVQQPAIQPGARRPDSGSRPDNASRHDSGPRHEPDSGLSRGAHAHASRLDAPGRAASDLHALVERMLTSCRAAEGRTALGSYGSSGLTPAIRRVSAHLPFGGLAPGSEADSLKSPDRLAAKLARLIARNPGRTVAELAATISDVRPLRIRFRGRRLRRRHLAGASQAQGAGLRPGDQAQPLGEPRVQGHHSRSGATRLISSPSRCSSTRRRAGRWCSGPTTRTCRSRTRPRRPPSAPGCGPGR